MPVAVNSGQTGLPLMQAEHQTNDVLPTAPFVVTEAQQMQEQRPSESAASQALETVQPEAQLRTQESKGQGQLLKHINFWHEDELKMAHPEVQVRQSLYAGQNAFPFLARGHAF